jgi:hypothetical protein
MMKSRVLLPGFPILTACVLKLNVLPAGPTWGMSSQGNILPQRIQGIASIPFHLILSRPIFRQAGTGWQYLQAAVSGVLNISFKKLLAFSQLSRVTPAVMSQILPIRRYVRVKLVMPRR